MAFSSKDNKASGSRRYTTRQIMELTEKRRKQMDEEARLRKLLAPLAEEAVVEQQSVLPNLSKSEDPLNPISSSPVDSFPASATNDSSPLENKTTNEMKTESNEPSGLMFAKSLVTPSHEGNNDPLKSFAAISKASENDSSAKAQTDALVSSRPVDSVVLSKILDAAQLDVQEATAFRNRTSLQATQSAAPGRSHQIILQILDFLFVGLSFALISLMMIHLLSAGWAKHYYDQSPFVLLGALCMLWLNRNHLQKREEWFWGSSVIVSGGLGVFISAALEGYAYIELAGFVIVSFGLLLWRYKEEAACRLFFPLAGFLFIFAPPSSWEQSWINPLNDVVYHWSSWAVNSFHVPVEYDGHQFHVAGSTIFFQGDPTVFRSMYIGVLLAIACLSFQNLAMVSGVALFASVALWAFFANIVRVATTGLIMENFGLEYAANFFSEYSFYMVLVVMLAGISLTAGFLPHKEDFD